MANETSKLTKSPLETNGLLHILRELIQDARQKVLRAVDAVQVQTCWKLAGISWNLSSAGLLGRNTVLACSQFWQNP